MGAAGHCIPGVGTGPECALRIPLNRCQNFASLWQIERINIVAIFAAAF